ncbi:D-arabinono-1,4-lactone oxidase [Micromonospora yangpuensis]|uniref:FAD-linked oxidoreductase n=1 Tax=Micromonospora yangpuensis TaxID=683228 RepID=A0A1C6V3D1_9ACTN|nr:D-arabinono-1,4-lactone oxidase [Micromonospora yangpuensis]GGM15095.1 L-gulonolactone oxidase [Micromonospora yangpuensis]SCL60872.1 FAD-linked oxidoreductase [Micromonospora yangpuensis]
MSTGQPGPRWRNWSGTVGCRPAQLLAPTTEDEVVAAVRAAGERGSPVRPVGSGHSFNALACTDGLLLDLSRYRGVLAVDAAAGEVTVLGGTTLGELAEALDRRGLALANLGTLAEQSVAGAISTGNHGSGLAHAPLSAQVVRLRLVTADGRVRTLDADREPEVFRCARTALGTLGVLSTVTLRCVPQFNLRVSYRTEPLDTVLDGFADWAAEADHVAFSWLPWQERAGLRALRVTAAPRTRDAVRRRYATTIDEVRCGLIGLAGRADTRAVPWLKGRRWRSTRPAVEYVDASHRVFTFPQPVRFLALEHALPLEATPDALRALRRTLRRAGAYSPYSVLVRVGAGDDSPLSPAYGRRTGYVNLTVPRTAGQVELLRAIEPVLRDHGGRPHWGKAHTATAEVLAPRYREWALFQRVRATLDPDGVFASDYTDRVLGPVRPARAPTVVSAQAGPDPAVAVGDGG